MTVLSAFIQVYVIQVFMNPCNLLSSGFTGVAILIHKICNLFNINFSISLGILIVVLRAKCKNVANKMQKIGFKKRHFKRLLNAK